MVNFRIDVVVDPSRASSGSRAVGRELQKVENRADSLRKSLRNTFLFLGGAALVTQAIRNLAQFEESLATLQAVSGATAEQFSALREEATRLGLETRFTANQAADALVNLSRAGFEVEEALEAVDDTLNLAVAGNLDLASAADISASSLRGFRLEAEEATRVTDVLTLAANSANTTLAQLGDAVKFVAPVAAGLGQSIEVTTAALGTLSDAGLKATLAGTGLRRVLAELEAPTRNSAKLLDALGVSTDDVRVSQVGLVGALEKLRDAGITTGEALQIFGQRGGPAFEVLVSNIPKIRQLNDELENSGGVAKKTADTIDKSLLGTLRRVRSAFEGVVLAAGQAGGTDALTSAFEGLAQALRLLAANIDSVGTALLGLGAVIGASKLIGLGANALTAAKNFVTLQLAISSGSAVVLGSAEAERQRALALVQSTSAQVASLQATLADVKAKAAHALATTNDTAALQARLAVQGQIASLEGFIAKQTDALTAAQARLTVATKAAAGSTGLLTRAWVSFKTAVVSTNVVLLAAVGTFFAVNKILKFQKGILEDIEQTYKNLEVDAKFAQLGHVIRSANQELKILQRSIDAQQERGFGPSDSQLERISQLQARIKGAREEIKAQAAEQKRLQELRKAALPTLDNLIGRLDREAEALRDLSRETEIQRRAQEELNQLILSGAKGLGPEAKQEIEDRLRVIESLKDQADLLEEIRGPQEKFIQQQAALNALYESGKISIDEFNAKLQELKDAIAESTGVSVDPFADQVKSLREMNEELRIQAENQGVQEQGLLIELELRRQGVELTNEQRRTLAALLFEQEELNTKLADERDARQEIAELGRRNEAAVDRLVQQTDATAQLAAQQEILNQRFKEGKIDQDTYLEATESLTLRQLQASTTIEAGWTRAFIKIKQEAEDFASVMESIVNIFADQLTNAVVEFAETGKFAWRDFATAVVKQLLRIIVRLLIIQALNAAFGGGAGAGASAAGAGSSAALAGSRADGGTVQPGRSFLVGENGPEVFQPEQTGTIVPNEKDQPQAKPEVNVQVVNVQDPNEIPQAINDGGSDDAIINALARNKDRVRQVVQ